MASSDLASAADRMAPGIPGTAIKFTFTAADSGWQDVTFHKPAAVGGFQTGQGAVYVSIKVTAAVHVAFGNSNASSTAVTNANAPLFEPADGWQDMVLTPDQTQYRLKGDLAGGDIYIWPSGR
jgi:hypothetical protein